MQEDCRIHLWRGSLWAVYFFHYPCQPGLQISKICINNLKVAYSCHRGRMFGLLRAEIDNCFALRFCIPRFYTNPNGFFRRISQQQVASINSCQGSLHHLLFFPWVKSKRFNKNQGRQAVAYQYFFYDGNGFCPCCPLVETGSNISVHCCGIIDSTTR
jgi:hypothetical protein